MTGSCLKETRYGEGARFFFFLPCEGDWLLTPIQLETRFGDTIT